MTKEKFKAFLTIRDSGITNMFDVKKVIELAKGMCDVVLTREDCMDCMQKFSNYLKEYKIKDSRDK